MKNNKSLLGLLKENNVKDKVYFTIEFYKQKPHWNSDYYDVFSGCSETFQSYRNKVLIDKFVVKASFELLDFENAIFRFNYKKFKVNPTELAYIKIIDDANIFQGKSWENTYFFITNINLKSTEVAIFQAQLDFWMTYWDQFTFKNWNSVKVLRKHMPRYRTDEGHKGEYDFSTNSCVLNVDQIEGQYTNLVSGKSLHMVTSLKGRKDNIYFTNLKFSNICQMWAYCIIIPKEADSVMTDTSDWSFTKISDILGKPADTNKLKYLFLDNLSGNVYSYNKNKIKGCPWFVFSLTEETKTDNMIIRLKAYPSDRNRNTYISYNYQIITFLGDRIATIFYTDHPIFYFNESKTYNNYIVENIAFIDSVSDRIDHILPSNIKEISLYSFHNFDNTEWLYEIRNEDKFRLQNYSKPLKEYTENDVVSLDQEPALFRYPHFEFEYSFYTMKGVLKINNELVLSNGWFEDYLNVYCSYVIHAGTILKYIFVKNGWYEGQYEMWKYGLFEENTYNFDFVSDAYQNFLLTQQSQFNNSYNQSMTNSILGMVETGIGIGLAPFTGGISVGLAGYGISNMVNNTKNMVFNQMSRQAQIQDLQRTPGTRINPSNSFSNTAYAQMMNYQQDDVSNTNKGILLIRQHRENEQWILFAHFHQHGYLVNKFLRIGHRYWFRSRHWFDFFQIEDFTNVIDNTKYNQFILNKFNNLFHRGIRLWHITEHFLDYRSNNKEIDDWQTLYFKE